MDASLSARTLDLNNPEDARVYVAQWVRDDGAIGPKDELVGSDEDFLRMAKQLFLYADKRPAEGEQQ